VAKYLLGKLIPQDLPTVAECDALAAKRRAAR
jgi:hypothetical protein